MPLNYTSYILSMIFVHNRIPHYFMLSAFIIFPCCVRSASSSPRSPPSSPDWDVLLAPKQRPFTKKRTFSHNQQNEAKRRRGSAWKDVSPLFQKQAERSRTQQRKERVKPNSKPMTFKSRKEYYHEKVRFLKEPGNELLLQEYKERISKENKTYLAKLKKEVEDGTATKERRKLFEKRKKNSKQRRTSSTQGR